MTKSVNLGFETSIDCSDGKNEDADILFQQLDTERKVYWAEPIQVTSISEGFSSVEDSDGFQSPNDTPAQDVSLSTVETMSLPVSSATTIKTDQTPRHSSIDESSSLTFAELLSLSATSQLKPKSHSVSVQIASFQSSHIVCRKDVPFWTESKYTRNLQSNLKLETYTYFYTVQKWAELQIQRNALINRLSHQGLYTVPNHQASSSSNVTHPPPVIFPSFSYFPLLSKDWKPPKSVTVMPGKCEAAPVCVDTGLWSHKQEEGLGKKNKLHQNNQTSTVQRYRSCDHKGNLSAQKCYVNHHHQTNPVSNSNFFLFHFYISI